MTIPLSSTAAGLYNYPDLTVGTYSITVEKDGFQKFVRNGIQIFANQVTEVNITLPLGSVSSTIEVTGSTPLVQTGTSQISNDFTTRQVTQLPNADPAGSPLYLALLAPGTTRSVRVSWVKAARLAARGRALTVSRSMAWTTTGST